MHNTVITTTSTLTYDSVALSLNISWSFASKPALVARGNCCKNSPDCSQCKHCLPNVNYIATMTVKCIWSDVNL